MEDIIKLSISITGIRKSFGPELSPITDFKIHESGNFSSFDFIDGTTRYHVIYFYHLTPKIKGEFEIRGCYIFKQTIELNEITNLKKQIANKPQKLKLQ